MPELPEVESLRRSLVPYIQGKKINSVEVILPKLVSGRGTKRVVNQAMADSFVNNISRKIVTGLTRRAKNIIFTFDDNSVMVVHLKMTGQLVFKPFQAVGKVTLISGGHPIELSTSELPNKHSYIIFYFENGTLFYNDVRQFGYLLHFSSLEEAINDGHFAKLGFEPLDDSFILKNFEVGLKRKTGNLKKVLLDQEIVVGLGNIYADEVCFMAKVRPNRLVKTLSKKEIKSLYEAINKIIPRAIELGGSSIADYLLADGSRGNYAREHKVYGRAGKECLVCGTILTKTVSGGRTTVYCKKCQK
ncbi:MAG: bifunctional DNA-formamidopyrimidine glycosylase/DNA-(apurinic or apyrimidinic site) lyase [candidate division SR1 bacterium]|nr:bifunctional DNA-formamidopyrimidine glycosylase/DNA-(apurinic or apyrimidinic site) lyase [candidate division SR1 bacterium]